MNRKLPHELSLICEFLAGKLLYSEILAYELTASGSSSAFAGKKRAQLHFSEGGKNSSQNKMAIYKQIT